MKSSIASFQKRTAHEVEEKDQSWFLSQLGSHCSEVVQKGKDFLIVCPFHADSNPSCGVDRHTGMFKCFACGAGGGWNKLAKAIGADLLKSTKEEGTFDASTIKDGLTRAFRKAGVVDPSVQQKQKDKVRPLVSPWRKTEGWRSIDGEFLHSLGCVRVSDLTHNVLRIGLPVRNLDGDLLGYTCRAIDPVDTDPKYIPLAADRVSWRKKELPTRSALFLVDRAIEEDWDTVVIVEGPYDALHLVSAGIPAMAILGTNNWTAEKAATISALGLRGVLVLMDRDRSGREAALSVYEDLRPNLKTKVINLPPSVKDPGDLSKKQIRWLSNKLATL